MRLLVVEDDDIVADAIARGLSAAKCSVHRVSSAEAAQAAMASEEFALAVIDVGLPGADGLTLVRRLRSSGMTMPTLILTARCRALMRRSSGALDGIIKLNRLNVDLPGKRLSIDGAEVELTAREWLLLECLVRRIGQVVSKERVQQALAAPDHDITPNAIEVHVSRLRAKLGEAAVIRSLRGLGYRLEEAKAP